MSAARSTRRCAPAQGGRRGERGLRNVVAACAEGYAFPTNLDRDQPVGGLAPQTQAELVWQALERGLGHRDVRRRAARPHGAARDGPGLTGPRRPRGSRGAAGHPPSTSATPDGHGSNPSRRPAWD